MDFDNLYYLDETKDYKAKPVTNGIEFLRAVTSSPLVRTIDIDQYWVSTLFLGRDRLQGTGVRKLLFETRVYKVQDRSNKLNDPSYTAKALHIEFWSTLHEAVIGHEYIAQLVRNKELPKTQVELSSSDY